MAGNYQQHIPSAPVLGQNIGSSWYQGNADALRRLRVIAGDGVSIAYGPDGATIAASVSDASAVNAPRCWEPTFSGSTIALSNCWAMRGHRLVAISTDGNQESPAWPTLTLATELEATLYIKINAETMAGELVSAIDETDEAHVYWPLFHIKRASASSAFGATLDYRGIPQLALYA